MTYRLGIDIGSSQTMWAAVARDGAQAQTIEGGTVESVVALKGGQLVAGAAVTNADPSTLEHVTRDFAQHLGDAAPMMIGGTPYGVESLVGQLVASVVATARSQFGAEPGAVVIVHDDGLDDYRTGLLTEAARLAGVPLASLVLVARSDAIAAGAASNTNILPGLEGAAGAALLGWDRHPDLPPASAAAGGGIGTAAGIAAGTAATIGGGAVLAASIGAGEAVAATASTAGAAATGTPLTTGAAATGTPLTTGAAATGTPLTPGAAGPAGTPLSPAGPGAAGPAGTPLNPPATGPGGTPGTPPPSGPPGLGPIARLPRRIPIIAAATTAVVGVVAVVAVIAVNNDDTPSVGTASGTISSSVISADVSSPALTTAPAGLESGAACVHGDWNLSPDNFTRVMESFAGGGDLGNLTVSGTTEINIAPDGLWTLKYEKWGISVDIPETGTLISVEIDGADTVRGVFNDDGTYSFSESSIGSRMTQRAVVNGNEVPLPATPNRTVQDGSGTFSCEGNVLQLSVEGLDALFLLNRAP